MNRPKKSLGQNFLQDKNIIKKIIDAFNPTENETIVEIGPGKGALTDELITKKINLFGVEIDKNLCEELRIKYPNLQLVNKDFLKVDFEKDITNTRCRVIGNIPYYATSQILLKLFENHRLIKDALIMMQLEVAQRLISQPKTKEYGILSVYTNFYSEAKLLFKVSKNVFYPKPEVDSAVVHFKFNEKLELNEIEIELFRIIIRTAFNQRRKTLRNSLRKLINVENQEKLKFDFNRRAEELSLNDFLYLAKNFKP
ncbi:MAG: ribosomal RNA small subunit methyltransferase A [Bacteroidetes bacterium]|nr:ribosomal RNA small subunit methyltransferase A [Bacteroidota bacterium]MBU2584916.1 ribosomal RNA small subunit methyltransferase A [Bacteroidota bacterium]